MCKNDNLLYLLICFTVDACLEGASVSIVTSLLESVDNTIVVCNFFYFYNFNFYLWFIFIDASVFDDHRSGFQRRRAS